MSEINIKMSAIYRASHDELPAQATKFGGHAKQLTDAVDIVVPQIALVGNHSIGPVVADVASELFLHMREMVRTFNDTATALDKIADDFVAVDEDAAAWARQH